MDDKMHSVQIHSAPMLDDEPEAELIAARLSKDWLRRFNFMKKPWPEMQTPFGKRTVSSNDCVWIIRVMR
jgi:hypothetical protein